MAEKEPAIVRIVNRSTGVLWEVVEGSPTHKRCIAQPGAYEILKPNQDVDKPPVVAFPPGDKPAKKSDRPEKSG
jgi:hypothetical protein